MSSSIYASVEEVFAFCTSRDGFEQQFPYAVCWLNSDRSWIQGTVVTFKFQFFKLGPFRLWLNYQAEIVELEHNVFFVDVMRAGPYQYFQHRHDFVEVENTTQYTDTIEFSLGYGALIDRYIGLPILRNTFEKRHRNLRSAMENRRADSVSNPGKIIPFNA